MTKLEALSLEIAELPMVCKSCPQKCSDRVKGAGGIQNCAIIWKHRMIEAVAETVAFPVDVNYKGVWILCKDQMPPMNDRVLVVYTDGYITIGERWKENEWLVDCGECDATDDEVFAWMPLPSPPNMN